MHVCITRLHFVSIPSSALAACTLSMHKYCLLPLLELRISYLRFDLFSFVGGGTRTLKSSISRIHIILCFNIGSYINYAIFVLLCLNGISYTYSMTMK